MADVYQIPWEYSDGNTISFKTNDLKITYKRLFQKVHARTDGVLVVTDPGKPQRIFNFTAIVSGNNMDILDGVMTGAITHTGAYPRITTLYWDGDSTESNIETAMTALSAEDMGTAGWRVSVTLTEKAQ